MEDSWHLMNVVDQNEAAPPSDRAVPRAARPWLILLGWIALSVTAMVALTIGFALLTPEPEPNCAYCFEQLAGLLISFVIVAPATVCFVVITALVLAGLQIAGDRPWIERARLLVAVVVPPAIFGAYVAFSWQLIDFS